MSERQGAMLLLAGGALAAIGSLLPWATVSSGFGSVSINGIEGDGRFTVVLGGALALLGFLRLGTPPRGNPIIGFLLAILLGIVGALAYSNLSGGLADAESEFVRASIGIGLYLVLAGAIAGIIGSVAWRPVKPTANV
jgi:hypothetical protein